MVVRNVANNRVVKNITMHSFDCFSELKGTKVMQYKKHDIQSQSQHFTQLIVSVQNKDFKALRPSLSSLT